MDSGDFPAEGDDSTLPLLLRRRAMDWLARREQSRQELFQKLRERVPEAEPSMVDAVLERLADEGLQSDLRFAEAFCRARIQKGKGPQRIRLELQQKGVDVALIEHCLSAVLAEEADGDWQGLAQQALQRRYGHHLPQSTAERQRFFRFLHQRGFSPDQIARVLDPRAQDQG